MEPTIVQLPIGDNLPEARLYYGQDVRDILRELPDQSVQCVVTSPPYWGLRDYGTGEAQIGLESTPEEYVENLVGVFREVRRVLRDDGVLWVNLGDSYARSFAGCWGNDSSPSKRESHKHIRSRNTPPPGLKDKDLVGIPWRVAFALQADGWYLRSDIIWSKPNPMPESVGDRPTKAHEYIFLFSKSPRYFYDQEAVKEDAVGDPSGNKTRRQRPSSDSDLVDKGSQAGSIPWEGGPKRNSRSVWTFPSKPYPGAHFAVFPPELAERCIKAATSERGCCSECGSPMRRMTVRNPTGWDGSRYGERAVESTGGAITGGTLRSTLGSSSGVGTASYFTAGWEPSCDCGAEVSHCTVLDPFSGSATTGVVALRLGCGYIGVDLNADYLSLAVARIRGDAPHTPEDEDEDPVYDLFGGDDA